MFGYDERVEDRIAPVGALDPIRSRSDDEARRGLGAADVVLPAVSGIALDLSGGTDDLRILLQDAAGETLMSFGPFPEEDVVAQWRSLALASGKTPMIKVSNGRTDALATQLGRLRLGPVHMRRSKGLRRRRPRFLVRRKSARLPQRPLIYRESEIARGAGA